MRRCGQGGLPGRGVVQAFGADGVAPVKLGEGTGSSALGH